MRTVAAAISAGLVLTVSASAQDGAGPARSFEGDHGDAKRLQQECGAVQSTAETFDTLRLCRIACGQLARQVNSTDKRPLTGPVVDACLNTHDEALALGAPRPPARTETGPLPDITGELRLPQGRSGEGTGYMWMRLIDTGSEAWETICGSFAGVRIDTPVDPELRARLVNSVRIRLTQLSYETRIDPAHDLEATTCKAEGFEILPS